MWTIKIDFGRIHKKRFDKAVRSHETSGPFSTLCEVQLVFQLHRSLQLLIICLGMLVQLQMKNSRLIDRNVEEFQWETMYLHSRNARHVSLTLVHHQDLVYSKRGGVGEATSTSCLCPTQEEDSIEIPR